MKNMKAVTNEQQQRDLDGKSWMRKIAKIW